MLCLIWCREWLYLVGHDSLPSMSISELLMCTLSPSHALLNSMDDGVAFR